MSRVSIGVRGELLADYVRWVSARIIAIRRRADYHPTLHFDTGGTIGMIFDANPVRMAVYLAWLGELAALFPLRIEHPVDVAAEAARSVSSPRCVTNCAGLGRVSKSS